MKDHSRYFCFEKLYPNIDEDILHRDRNMHINTALVDVELGSFEPD